MQDANEEHRLGPDVRLRPREKLRRHRLKGPRGRGDEGTDGRLPRAVANAERCEDLPTLAPRYYPSPKP